MGIDVVAGLHSEMLIPELHKRFLLSSEEFFRQASDDGDTTFDDGDMQAGAAAFRRTVAEAIAYAESLMDPKRMNYVKLEWTWL